MINDAQLGKPAMEHDAPVDMRNKEAIKAMGDFKNQPKPPKLQLRNEDAIRNMGDPSKIGPSADESKKGMKRAKARKARAKGTSKKAGARVVAADRPKGRSRVVAADKPVVAPAAPLAPVKS